MRMKQNNIERFKIDTDFGRQFVAVPIRFINRSAHAMRGLRYTAYAYDAWIERKQM